MSPSKSDDVVHDLCAGFELMIVEVLPVDRNRPQPLMN